VKLEIWKNNQRIACLERELHEIEQADGAEPSSDEEEATLALDTLTETHKPALIKGIRTDKISNQHSSESCCGCSVF